MGRVVAWNLGLLAVGLVVVELIFGGWLDAFRAPGLWRLSIYRDVTWQLPVQTLYRGPATITYRRDEWGLRGQHHRHPSEIEILVVGGSTAEERMIGEGETWADRLAACLGGDGGPVRVANAGIAGQSTKGIIANFEQWFPHLPGLKPRMVVAYVGLNDRALQGRDSFEDLASYNESQNPLMIERVKQNSALYALFRVLRGNVSAARAGVAYQGGEGGAVASDQVDADIRARHGERLAKGSPEYDLRLAEVEARTRTELDRFNRRLRRLVSAIRDMGAEPVLVTQSAADYRQDDETVWGNLSSFLGMRIYNRVTLGVCSEMGLRCIDLDAAIRVGDGDFFDGVHATPQGSRKVAEVICNGLKR